MTDRSPAAGRTDEAAEATSNARRDAATDGGPSGPRPDGRRWRQPGLLVRRLVAALVFTPGHSTAVVLTVGPYLWLVWYVAGTALGTTTDPIIAGDWLTLLFTAYALTFPLALAHRTLQIGMTELTQEYLVDVVVLLWLTVFYLVWSLTRGSVDPSTSVTELYGPVVAGDPLAIQWTAIAAAAAVLVLGLSASRITGSALFRSPFRTALVTAPGTATALVLVTAPGAESVLWPAVGGGFVGALLAGVRHLPAVAGGFARGVFVCLATVIWAIGVALWVVVHRQAPPTRRLSLHQGRPGSGAGDTAAATDTSSDDPDAVAADGGRDR